MQVATGLETTEILKKVKSLIEFANKELGIKKTDIYQKVFETKRPNIEDFIEKYQWGVLQAIEEYIDLTYEEYLKIKGEVYTRLTAKPEKLDVKTLKLFVSIADRYNEIFPNDLNRIRKEIDEIWEAGFKNFFHGMNFKTIVEELFKKGIVVVLGNVEKISGLAYKNFILVNYRESQPRKIWTIFHELFHIRNEDFGFVRMRSKDSPEKFHEKEVANFFMKGVELPQSPLETESELQSYVKKVRKEIGYYIAEYAVYKYLKDKGLFIKKLDYRKYNNKNKRDKCAVEISNENRQWLIKFPGIYLDKIFTLKDINVISELLGLNQYQLIREIGDINVASLREYAKKNYSY